MPVNNSDIARLFDKTADLLEISGTNQFRVRAYRGAAVTVSSLSQSAKDMIDQGQDLSKLPGIGRDLAGKIGEIVKGGSFAGYEEIRKAVPEELSDLMRISGLGAKRVKMLYESLNIRSLDDLEKAAKNHRIRSLAGFGKKTEDAIINGIKLQKGKSGRQLLATAEKITEALLAGIGGSRNLKSLTVAGSNRRRKDTVGDMDILATVDEGSDIMERFTGFEDVARVVSRGSTGSSVILKSGFKVDLRVVPEESRGAALAYFTGSKGHTIEIRKLGVKRGLKINEYGVFRGEERVGGKSEEEVYAAVGLPYIEPELRENRGEIEAAKKGKLPELVKVENIRGDLHIHTDLTDGRYPLEEMVEAAKKRGREYIAICDHSKHLRVARGLDARALRKRVVEINELNARVKGINILNGIEVDILENGTLDLPDSALRDLDVTVCSVHYRFNMTKKEMTRRIIKAMGNKYFNILGHPTGRLLNGREPYGMDLKEILRAARDNGCFMELNSYPDRLDLNDADCKLAKEMGVKVAVNTDSHGIYDLDFIKYGINQARRGWLEASDVINTRPLVELMKLLKRS